MSNRNLAKAIQGLPRRIWRLSRSLTKNFVDRVLRLALFNPRRDTRTAGFVLPTTVLLILVVVLTVGALTFRAYNRNTQVIAEAQQRVIYNAATPAIDRARSKLEFLFDGTDQNKNRRLTSGVPNEKDLYKFLLNTDADKIIVKDADGKEYSPYDFPDETRVDLDPSKGNGVDNAWSFPTDTDGNGEADATVVYSIIFNTPPVDKDQTLNQVLVSKDNETKANELIVRNGPLGNEIKGLRCKTNSTAAVEEGWFEDKTNTATLRKNFQIDALVIPDNPKAAAVTLEMQQDRQINRGNKWGAWFRNDLEIYPGPAFNWNGAMHTEGSLIIGGTVAGVDANDSKSIPTNGFIAHLISAPASCLYEPASNSEITVTEKSRQGGGYDYIGVAAAGDFRYDRTNAASTNAAAIYIHGTTPSKNVVNLKNDTDAIAGTVQPSQISIDPVRIMADDGYQNRSGGSNENVQQWGNLESKIAVDKIGRIKKASQKAPYIDDLYRADDLWGPKPKYNSEETTSLQKNGKKVGDKIEGAIASTLTEMPAPPAAGESTPGVGLDGYWERRARNEGLRILVSERLELGNLNTWFAPQDKNSDGTYDVSEEGDPLYPPTVVPHPSIPPARSNNVHEDLQRRSLRDNLSAVQTTAIYHRAVNNDYPVACLATTSHPGTPITLRQSINFKPTKFVKGSDSASNQNEYLLSNFFTGRGTNGWEFQPPADSAGDFETQISNGTSPLRIALQNLANFAGDPDGAFPPKSDDKIHPYPALTMWGNFSNLRRALKNLESGSYAALSLADKTYLQTAACTLGMLANIKNDEELRTGNNRPLLTDVAERLSRLMDGVVNPGSGNFEVLPKGQLSTYRYNPNGTYAGNSAYKAEDYFEVPPEAFIGGLKQQIAYELPANKTEEIDNDPRIRLAELIMLQHQVRRDRTFGFRPSPAFGEYIAQINGVNRLFPAACDPDQFPLFAMNRGGVFSLSTLPLTGREALDASIPVSSLPYNLDVPGIPTRTSANLAALAARPSVKWDDSTKTSQYDFDASRQDGFAEIRDRYALYRLALSRLCGTVKVPDNYEVGNQELEESKQPRVLPKFPSLYFLFPEEAHSLVGALKDDIELTGTSVKLKYDHRQPGNPGITLPGNPLPEPYIQDDYVRQTALSVSFQPVSIDTVGGRSGLPPTAVHPLTQTGNIQPTLPPVTYPATNPAIPNIRGVQSSSRPYKDTLALPVPDRSVAVLALKPTAFPSARNSSSPYPSRQLPGIVGKDGADLNLGYSDKSAAQEIDSVLDNDFNVPTNFILAPPTPEENIRPVAVPFLERAFFDGRQSLLTRTLDIDMGMLRVNAIGDDHWLPDGGIVYAFREDAVREDGIKRPNGAIADYQQCADGRPRTQCMNLTNFASPTDPGLSDQGISIKPIDHLPDPERRAHGFRLRNGERIKKNLDAENKFRYRGLSFFTDQPVYVQGDFNLHQGENGERIEEFAQHLVEDSNTTAYTAFDFYEKRTSTDLNFANVEKDFWRPSEILADSITFLSRDFCDGSIADSFIFSRQGGMKVSGAFVPDFTLPGTGQVLNMRGNQQVYNKFGLYGPGCSSDGHTSFHNQNRPTTALPANFDWVRETSSPATLPQRNATSGDYYWADFTSPIKISRAGQPLVISTQAVSTGATSKPTLPAVEFYASTSRSFMEIGTPTDDAQKDARRLMQPESKTRINSIVVSGIHPSRAGQGYGGLQNFPRFLESWNGDQMFFAGSFLQLNYTNYGTAPYESEAWEPGSATILGTGTTPNESIPYYRPPLRFWGYDVALQLSPAGPAAARFVSSDKNRSEFYNEPPANDPYIRKLCSAIKVKKPEIVCPNK
jgi:hypothetical protein